MLISNRPALRMRLRWSDPFSCRYRHNYHFVLLFVWLIRYLEFVLTAIFANSEFKGYSRSATLIRKAANEVGNQMPANGFGKEIMKLVAEADEISKRIENRMPANGFGKQFENFVAEADAFGKHYVDDVLLGVFVVLFIGTWIYRSANTRIRTSAAIYITLGVELVLEIGLFMYYLIHVCVEIRRGMMSGSLVVWHIIWMLHLLLIIYKLSLVFACVAVPLHRGANFLKYTSTLTGEKYRTNQIDVTNGAQQQPSTSAPPFSTPPSSPLPIPNSPMAQSPPYPSPQTVFAPAAQSPLYPSPQTIFAPTAQSPPYPSPPAVFSLPNQSSQTSMSPPYSTPPTSVSLPMPSPYPPPQDQSPSMHLYTPSNTSAYIEGPSPSAPPFVFD